MAALTAVQETTMRQWALTAKTRPGKRAKWFLRLNRGLSEEQIDAWWDNAMTLQKLKEQIQHEYQETQEPSLHVQNELPPYTSLGRPVSNASSQESLLQQRLPQNQQQQHSHQPHAQPQSHYLSPNTLPSQHIGLRSDDVLKELPSFPRQVPLSPYGHSQRGSMSTLSSMATSLTSSTAASDASSIFSVPSHNWEMVPSNLSSNRSSTISYNSSYLPQVDTNVSSFSIQDFFPTETQYEHGLPSSLPPSIPSNMPQSIQPNMPSNNGAFMDPSNLSGLNPPNLNAANLQQPNFNQTLQQQAMSQPQLNQSAMPQPVMNQNAMNQNAMAGITQSGMSQPALNQATMNQQSALHQSSISPPIMNPSSLNHTIPHQQPSHRSSMSSLNSMNSRHHQPLQTVMTQAPHLNGHGQPLQNHLSFEVPTTNNMMAADHGSSQNSLSRVSSASGSQSPWHNQYQDASMNGVGHRMSTGPSGGPSVPSGGSNHPHPHNHNHIMTDSHLPPAPPPPPPPAKQEKLPVKFACTVCTRPFASKGDWKRHEGSQCEPQKSWVCMMGDTPALTTPQGSFLCCFCDLELKPHPSGHHGDRIGERTAEMLSHLEKEHKVNQCLRKGEGERTFRRKDKLKTHLQRVHGLVEGGRGEWERWSRGAGSAGVGGVDGEKKAWGCGFCGGCLFTWDGRLDHIAEHFENRLDISQWSHSLMIIGLLKQPKPEFNVLEAWRSIVDPDDDRCLEWSREDAAELKSKLEYRRGSPLELAREAFRTAMTMAGGEGDGGGGSDGEGDRMSIVEEALWKEPKGEMG